jgi:hypothetical protein
MDIKEKLLIAIILFFSVKGFAQVANTGMVEEMDSSNIGKILLSGYVDVYYGYDFNEPKTSDRPYAVSSARHNEININLAYLGMNYTNGKVRARFIPGFGTYMNANYSSEAGTLRNLVEANAGVCLSTKRDIWLDAGVIGSPYTNESAISKDHFMYTRSFSAEFVPYYLTGVKLSGKLTSKITGYLYILNGWQRITDTNNPLSFGTQIEYRPNNKLLINWNTYVGDESSIQLPQFGIRYFSDVYAIYNPDGRFSFTTCGYAGAQQIKEANNTNSYAYWWQANFIAKVKLSEATSVAGRVEYFNDEKNVQITPITGAGSFTTGSAGLCFNMKISKNALFRIEQKHFFSENTVYIKRSKASNSDNLLIGNLTVWF